VSVCRTSQWISEIGIQTLLLHFLLLLATRRSFLLCILIRIIRVPLSTDFLFLVFYLFTFLIFVPEKKNICQTQSTNHVKLIAIQGQSLWHSFFLEPC
jgi:hypothetical protein